MADTITTRLNTFKMKKVLFALSALAMVACTSKQQCQLPLADKANFAKEVDGKQVSLFTIKNDAGVTAQITNYGGRIVNLFVPDKNGAFQDVVMGCEDRSQD